MKVTDDKKIKEAVKEHYASLVSGNSSCGCCSPTVSGIEGFGDTNYDSDLLSNVPTEAASYSFGCGNPLAFTSLKPGDTVLDIGSGAGLDVILAAQKVGSGGIVFGLDMTPEMIAQGEENVARAGLKNVTFLMGEAENMPLDDNTVDWVISNCVINLSPDKEKVFSEIYRILKPGGQILISDMVADNLPEHLLDSLSAWAGCLAGAVSEDTYLTTVREAGLKEVEVVDRLDYDLSGFDGLIEEYFPGQGKEILAQAIENGIKVSSIRLSAKKPA